MDVFACSTCDETLFFHNLSCRCGAQVTFLSADAAFSSLARPCANRQIIGCNWAAADGQDGRCASCLMTEVTPDADAGANAALWASAEAAKRWVLHNLGRWGWFADGDPGPRPVFHLLSEWGANGEAKVLMGHEQGLVTINVSEADPVTLTRRQDEMGERYRTMIGHFRHEIAHFLFERLKGRDGFMDAFRTLFGDPEADYGAALATYYAEGPPPNWADRHVTAYAAAHPHEDWAESVAHLLHLTDIADSAAAVGVGGSRAYEIDDAQDLIREGVTLGLALNHVNRSMGLADIYPFVLSDICREKLAFVHRQVRRTA